MTLTEFAHETTIEHLIRSHLINQTRKGQECTWDGTLKHVVKKYPKATRREVSKVYREMGFDVKFSYASTIKRGK